MSGWKLSAALVAKHFSNLGDTVAVTLANFDPETATEVDREKLQEQLRQYALRLAEARRKYELEKKEADDLAALIAADEKTAVVLLEKFERNDGSVDEATLNEFASNLEAMKARLPGEEQDVKDAKDLLDALQDILNTVEKKLADFDRVAKETLNAINRAKADKERQDLRVQQQQEVASLRTGLGSASTALGALGKRAEQLRIQADATKIVADIGQKPLDRANAVEEARRIAAGTSTAGESAADRLRRLSSKAA